MQPLSPLLPILLVGFSLGPNATAFSPQASTTSAIGFRDTVAKPYRHSPRLIRRASQKPVGNDEEDDQEEDEQERITRDQFYRDLMGLSETENSNDQDEQQQQQQKSPKKKGKNQKYGSTKRPHDNRDSLPFLVQVMTPPEEPYEQVIKKTKKKSKRKREGKADNNDDDDLGIVGETLGEFAFEKNTGSGDKIEIDNQIYLVQRARCQYRYAGAQKFVMVRKILQVKPMQRAMQEDYILRQWNAAPAPESE